MFSRRDFLKSASATGAAALISRHPASAQLAGDADNTPHFTSPFVECELSRTLPEFVSLNIDGLGKGRRGPSMIAGRTNVTGYRRSVRNSADALHVEYRVDAAGDDTPASWAFDLTGEKIVLTSNWSGEFEPAPFVFHFNLNQVHSTALGLFQADGLLATPALLHFPGQGSMRLSADVPGIGLTYTSDLSKQSATLSLPGATFTNQRITYALDITAIHPSLPGIADDPRFDAFRRNWLDTLQINPQLKALANNTASDTCAFCYYEYADIAALTPPLAEGLTALDLVRQTLDRMLAGGNAYGLAAVPDHPSVASDTYPAMVIAAANVARVPQNSGWLAANYAGIRDWAESMLATDTTGNGLTKYAASGNSDSWGPLGFPKIRPSNWWDTIGFGYEDAYGNALAYRAYRNMTELARSVGRSADSVRYMAAAEKIRSIFFKHFYDPETGVLGGWRSADGQLHDYYFLWVNGIAIHYGLVEKPQANAIMDKLMAKMKEVGYDKFNMGLPGNLITVALKDYVHRTEDGRYGGGVKPDNSDGFQNYENGGATGSFAFFTLAALYDLGRSEEADAILFPMLKAYGNCEFEGRDAKGNSNDWRRWDGTAMGYEGLLTDNYYALLAVTLRQSEIDWRSGFRPATTLA
jgi:Bacterial alpha-L-rhamnosidase 6 hairpin glycosidase domain/TAT (twin-arginine translocation) pathway signal sequence